MRSRLTTPKTYGNNYINLQCAYLILWIVRWCWNFCRGVAEHIECIILKMSCCFWQTLTHFYALVEDECSVRNVGKFARILRKTRRVCFVKSCSTPWMWCVQIGDEFVLALLQNIFYTVPSSSFVNIIKFVNLKEDLCVLFWIHCHPTTGNTVHKT